MERESERWTEPDKEGERAACLNTDTQNVEQSESKSWLCLASVSSSVESIIPLEIFSWILLAFSPCSLDSRALPWGKHIIRPLLSHEIHALCAHTWFFCIVYIFFNIVAPSAAIYVLFLCCISQRSFVRSQRLWCKLFLCCFDFIFVGDAFLCLCSHASCSF